MPKSPDAFRTISEVAEWLDIQAHVLRFWESKFTQVKPIKRAGGRRYYRPADMLLLGGIKKLLHEDGLTIKGVQKILREEGMSHVVALSGPLDEADAEYEQGVVAKPAATRAPEPQAVVLPFEPPKDNKPEPSAPAPAPEPVAERMPEAVTESEPDAPEPGTDDTEIAAETAVDAKETLDITGEPLTEAASAPAPVPSEASDDEQKAVSAHESSADTAEGAPEKPLAAGSEDETDPTEKTAERDTESVAQTSEPDAERKPGIEAATSAPTPAPEKTIPEQAEETPTTAEPQPEVKAAEEAATTPKPRDIGMPEITPENEIHAQAAALTRAYAIRSVDGATAAKIKPLLSQLTALRDRMAAPRGGTQPKS
jgi:DNA-binding transcriptional MerR regulator